MNQAAKVVETRTLHGILIDEGYIPVNLVKMHDVVDLKRVVNHISPKTHDRYQILPDQVAFGGSGWILEGPSHIVYVKFNEEGHTPEFKSTYQAHNPGTDDYARMALTDDRLRNLCLD